MQHNEQSNVLANSYRDHSPGKKIKSGTDSYNNKIFAQNGHAPTEGPKNVEQDL
jgi:hypothetical protein